MVKSPTKKKAKLSETIHIDASSADEAMSESSNQGATTSFNANKNKKVPSLPSIDDKFLFLRKSKSRKGKETHVFKCIIPDCTSKVIIF